MYFNSFYLKSLLNYYQQLIVTADNLHHRPPSSAVVKIFPASFHIKFIAIRIWIWALHNGTNVIGNEVSVHSKFTVEILNFKTLNVYIWKTTTSLATLLVPLYRAQRGFPILLNLTSTEKVYNFQQW